MKTQRLYYEDSYIKDFKAKAISCEKRDGFYAVILDKTAFFPEGGGQKSDSGFIGSGYVFEVLEENGEIIHKTKEPLEVNKEYFCKIDWDKRFLRMFMDEVPYRTEEGSGNAQAHPDTPK